MEKQTCFGGQYLEELDVKQTSSAPFVIPSETLLLRLTLDSPSRTKQKVKGKTNTAKKKGNKPKVNFPQTILGCVFFCGGELMKF